MVKLRGTPDEHGSRMMSEGKLLEILPYIIAEDGTPMMLPPIVYEVPNWLLGYKDYHVTGMPYTIHFNERQPIPGSNSAYGVQLSFSVRVLEHSPGMVSNDNVATVDIDAVVHLINALREKMR